MNDGPTSAASFARAHAVLASADSARMAELDARIAAERTPEYLEARRLERARKAAQDSGERQTLREIERAEVPHWPTWAMHPTHAKPGHCAACGKATSVPGSRGRANTTGLCAGCGKRAGRFLPRVVLALKRFREGSWTP